MKKKKENKNIIFIGGGIVLAILLYYFFSPYQQCVKGYVKMQYSPSAYNSPSENAAAKARTKARGQVVCAKR